MTKASTISSCPQYSGEGFRPGQPDVGDVSWQTPTAQIEVAVWPAGVPRHSWQVVACGKSKDGAQGDALCGQGHCLRRDRASGAAPLEKAKSEFKERSASGHVCPIEPDAVPIALSL